MSNTLKPPGDNSRDIISHLQELIATNTAPISRFLKRAIYKVRRTIYAIPPVKSFADQAYATKVARYKASLPKLNAEDQAILETLQKTGTFSIPIEDLQLESTQAFLKTMANLVAELKDVPAKDQVLMDLDPGKFKERPEVFLWGIEQRFLNIIEHYIGLPIYYHGCSLRRDIVTNRSASDSVRSWHLDGEDRTVVKIIVYLNDVGLDGGHYEYIPKDLTQETVKKMNYYLGYLDDQTIMNCVPKKDWQGCIGKLGTVIITNTSHIFHRAKPPEKEDRFSISFCYTSNKPPYSWGCASFPENLEQIQNQLNEKQRNVLINKNKLFGMKL
ncbi:2OG-Fe(II) oxygenase [Xenococcus sp. PCC 7305]|uniref:2OG-Fe(II) oxygenase n=1 Tax=Xenococcus sp. PCC 7305 TaxID=102125 RepID=UPI00118192C8|nr:2OG-Fe(II) oxygenase [Xenococcus sp. PCC 7305]